MILAYFKPLLKPSPNLIGHSLAQRAYPLDGRVPEPLVKILQKLERH